MTGEIIQADIQPGDVIAHGIDRLEMHKRLNSFEDKLACIDGARFQDDVAPLEHFFGEGLYVRKIFMPKGLVTTTLVHKYKHPFFVLCGECIVVSDVDIRRIKAPYWGMTEPGTKRVLEILEDTVWITVHATDGKDPDVIKKEITVEHI